MTSHDPSPRALAAAVVLLAAILMISRLIIERAPAREWGIALLLLALGIGLLLWDSYARRPLPRRDDAGTALQSEPVIREYLPPAPSAALIAPAPAATAQAELHQAKTNPIPDAQAEPAVMSISETSAPPSAEPDARVDAASEAEPAADSASTDDPGTDVKAQTAEGSAEPEQPAHSEPPTSRAKAAAADDDLTIIEGIGPKISAALSAAGIRTYADLAAASETQIREILAQAHLRIVGSVSDMISTWAEQASLAAAGQLDALRAWQAAHKAGRK